MTSGADCRLQTVEYCRRLPSIVDCLGNLFLCQFSHGKNLKKGSSLTAAHVSNYEQQQQWKKKAGKKAEELKIIWEPSSKHQQQQQRAECALPSSHFTIFHSVFPFAVCRCCCCYCCCWLASLISDKHSMQLKSLGNAIFHSFVCSLQHAALCGSMQLVAPCCCCICYFFVCLI